MQPVQTRSILSPMHTFHNAATVAADGAAFTVGAYKTLIVDIDGTTTSHTLEFKYTSTNGIAKTLKGLKISDWSTGTSTTGTAESWEFDTEGLSTVIMDLSAMVAGGGSLTVTGRGVA